MRPHTLLLSMVFLFGLLAGFAPAAGTPSNTQPAAVPDNAPRELRDISYKSTDGGFELMLQGQNLTDFRKFQLTDPFRLVVDLKNTACKYNRNVLHVNDDVVQKIRVSRFDNSGSGTVRIVLDLNKNVQDIQLQPGADGLKVTVGPAVAMTAAAPQSGSEIPVDVIPTAAPAAAASGAPAEQPQAEMTDANIVRIPDPVVQPKMLSEPPQPPAPEPIRLMSARVRTDGNAAAMVQDDQQQSAQYTGEPITLDIKDADIVDFFRLISDIEGLNIVVDPSVSGTISMKVENVPWDQVFDLAMKNNRLAKVIEGNVVRIGTLDAFKEEEKSREELKRAKETITDIIKVNYATASDLVDKVTPLLTESGEIKTDTRTNSIVIRDIPERIDDARRLVKALDMPEHQVEIESRIISASRDYARSIGVQVGFVIGNLERITVGGPNTFGTIGGTRPSATPSSTYSAGNDVTGRGASQAQATENAAISVGTEGNNQRGNYNWSFPAQGATSGIGISVGNILDTFLLDASITAAESNGQVRIISQPKVQAQNNRAATIEQGIQFPVQVVENNTVTVRFFSASLKLSVLPQITEEGTVLMKITVENNRADFVNTVNGIPSIITSMSSTEVLVADGGTTVIGGILLDTDQRNTDKVPYLGDIPILGTFFRRDTNQKQTQEILFFLTPRIIK
jgi:type IV pilus assembly protein PilQ